MRLDDLPNQINIGHAADLQQNDGQVSRNGMAPESGLPPAIAGKHVRFTTQRRVHVDHRSCQARVKLCFGFGGIDLPQIDPAVGPGDVKYPIGEIAIAVFSGQRNDGFARFAYSAHHVERDGLIGFKRDHTTDRHDGIQHGPICVGKCARFGHCKRRLERSGSADKPASVRLEGCGSIHGIRYRHQMEQPGLLLADTARSSGTNNCLAVGKNFGLNEKIAKGRVQRIRRWRCQHDFRVTRDFDHAARTRTVCQANAPQFDVIFRRNGDFSVRLDPVVTPPEFGTSFGKDCLIGIRLFQCRLECSGPEFAGFDVTQVTEHSPVVPGTVLPPPRHGKVLPVAVAASGIRHHDAVTTIREQLDFRARRVGTAHDAHRQFLRSHSGSYLSKLWAVRLKNGL